MKLDELVNANYNYLKQNDLHIWNYISSHKKDCYNLTIDELANKCNVSRTTVLRFAQRISLKRYSELKTSKGAYHCLCIPCFYQIKTIIKESATYI